MARQEYTQAGIATATVVNKVINSSDAAYSVFASTLKFGRPSVSDQEKLKGAINISQATSAAPRWLDVPNLLSEVMRISSPAIWAETLRRGDAKQVAAIAETMETTIEQVPMHISEANKPLYGFTPILALAAAFGTDVYTKGIIKRGDPALGPWDNAVYETAQHFQGVATSPENLMERMRELFPDNDSDKQPYSAFNIIQRTGVFNNQGATVTCLVIKGTQHFFEAYGRALREDKEPGDYGHDFAQAILPKSYKDQLKQEAAELAAWEAKRRGRN